MTPGKLTPMRACLIQFPAYKIFLKDYQQAYADYLRAVDGFNEFPIGDQSPEAYEACDRLMQACDRLNLTADTLMAVPAPDLEAVAFKMTVLLMLADEFDDAPALALEQAIAAAKSGDARTAHKLSVPAVKWVDSNFNWPGRKCPETTILSDLRRLARN